MPVCVYCSTALSLGSIWSCGAALVAGTPSGAATASERHLIGLERGELRPGVAPPLIGPRVALARV